MEKKQSRLDVRKFSFSQRTINVWNKLSTECVHASKEGCVPKLVGKTVSKKILKNQLFLIWQFCIGERSWPSG